MVARVKAQLRAFQGRYEDEEESSGTETEAMESSLDPEAVAEQDELSEPEAPEGVAMPNTSRSPNSTLPICSLTRSELSLKSPQFVPEESEEESLGNESDDDKTGRLCNLEDAKATVARMLEDLRHGNVPNSSSPLQCANGVLALLRDRTAMRTAQEELAGVAKENKLGDFVLARIQAMAAFLNLFLDEDLGYNWTKASIITAKAHGRGKTRARTIREWVLTFIHTGELPHHHMCWKRATALADEGVVQAIRLALGEKGKDGRIDATTLIDVVSSPEIQARFVDSGIDKQAISERTAHRWLGELGWKYGKQKNGMYIDGHEREDVVEYRSAFVERFQQNERRFHIWDDNGNELPRPSGFPVLGAVGRFRLILITHDESTFFQNDQRKTLWEHTSKNGVPRPKGEGQSLMISDFLTADWGRLRDNDRCVFTFFLLLNSHIYFSEARIVFKPGKNRDGWFSANDLLNQVDHAIDIFEGLTKGWAQGLFLFDNAPSHQKRAENALSARRMPKGVCSHPSQFARHSIESILSAPKKGWTHFQGGARMRNSWLANNEPQLFYFPEDHPTMPGWFKGMEVIIRERGLWPAKGLAAQCPEFHCDAGCTDCCCRRLLFSQPDFMAQKSQLQESIESRGHLCDFYPKYHCELNFIEQYWGAAKLRYRAAPRPTTVMAMEKLVKNSLDEVPLLQIRR